MPAALAPAPSRHRRRVFALTFAAALMSLLALASGASADLLTPESGGSPNADSIDTLYKIVMAVAIVVFVGVEGVLLYSLIKFRVRKDAVPAQIRGNTKLEIAAQDVAHSWWILKLGGKFDAVPGHLNFTWFKIPKPGVFRGQCAELCGRNHADMTATVRAIEPAQFKVWLADKQREIEAANTLAQKRRVEESAASESGTEGSGGEDSGGGAEAP